MSKLEIAGQIRQSQILFAYGPGAMVDLPAYSVLIGGLESWSWGANKYGPDECIQEERLATKVTELLGLLEKVKLCPPPAAKELEGSSSFKSGIRCEIFPQWFVAQIENLKKTKQYPENVQDQATWTDPKTGNKYFSRPLVVRANLEKGKYRIGKESVPVVPMRFVQACRNGHLSDINWHFFVHKGSSDCRRDLQDLWLDEGGSGNDFAEIFVRCASCGQRRPLSQALIGGVLGNCSGAMPWISKQARQECGRVNCLLTRNASNAYFPQTMTVISLPEQDTGGSELHRVVSRLWTELSIVEEVGELRYLRRLKSDLEPFSDEEVMREIEVVRNLRRALDEPKTKIKPAEIQFLLSGQQIIGEDSPDSPFYGEVTPLGDLCAPLAGRLDRLILVHRLREVVALTGFTRLAPKYPDINGEYGEATQEVKAAPLEEEIHWVPAIENKGEGIFLSLSSRAVEAWRNQPALRTYEAKLRQAWLIKVTGNPKFPGLPYILLHSLSHLLINSLSLTCGYPASALRERIYAGENGHGILLYTSASGSAGTMGGLVAEGKHLREHLLRALDMGRLCSSDPLCAQTELTHESVHLSPGAACHSCLLISESSCESGNDFLDRSLVVGTVANLGVEFFQGQL